MKLIAVVFILSGLAASAQFDTLIMKKNIANYGAKPLCQIDTIVDDGSFDTPPMLVGTMVLPGTENQLWLKNFNLLLDRVVFSPCNSEPPIFVWNPDDTISIDTNEIKLIQSDFFEIRSVELNRAGLTIDIKIWENCCHHFLCDAVVMDDSVLSLMYYSYGKNYCDCDCCFGLVYYFNFMGGQEDEFKKIKWVMINDWRETIVPLSSFTE